MAHLAGRKSKLLVRIRRIQGQLAAVAAAVEEGKECNRVLQTLAACRGALNGLSADILEDHIREHIVPVGSKWSRANAAAVEETVAVIQTYLK